MTEQIFTADPEPDTATLRHCCAPGTRRDNLQKLKQRHFGPIAPEIGHRIRRRTGRPICRRPASARLLPLKIAIQKAGIKTATIEPAELPWPALVKRLRNYAEQPRADHLMLWAGPDLC
ncbi:MAG: hypothetical protein IPJ99_00380 [Betaproteobacteria bacterium]|nr:hypothetical protein [Betaproteobacteria bacterium]